MNTRQLKPSTILKRARKLIEKGWCRHAWAKTSNGVVIHNTDTAMAFNDVRATNFCITGALYRAGGVKTYADGTKSDHPAGDAQKFLKRATNTETARQLIDFNNLQRDKRPVLAAFDRAIKLAQQEGR